MVGEGYSEKLILGVGQDLILEESLLLIIWEEGAAPTKGPEAEKNLVGSLRKSCKTSVTQRCGHFTQSFVDLGGELDFVVWVRMYVQMSRVFDLVLEKLLWNLYLSVLLRMKSSEVAQEVKGDFDTGSDVDNL